VSSKTMRPSESQVEAAKLLIRMLEKDGEFVDDALRAVAEADPAPDTIAPDGADVHREEQPISESVLTPAEHQELVRFSRLPQSTRKVAGKPRRLARLYKLSDFAPKLVVVRTTKRHRSGVALVSTPKPDPAVAAAVAAANKVERERIAERRNGTAKPRD
jgi:hypothetical protein